MKYRIYKCCMTFFCAVGIVKGIVNICGPIVKGREKKSQLRSANRVGNAAVMKFFTFRLVLEAGLCLLYRANRTQNIGIVLFRAIRPESIVLALKGNIIAVTAQ